MFTFFDEKIIVREVIALFIVGVLIFVAYNQKDEQMVLPPNGQPAATPEEPQKMNFGTETSSDFPTDIPVEKGAVVEKNYGLNFSGQKQMAVIFRSAKTVNENYSIYYNYLLKYGWNVLSKNENSKASLLSAVNSRNEIEVTIVENTESSSEGSRVSIIVLKK
jgi:hypothetical protein